jgi:outer membrane immunogenic protein
MRRLALCLLASSALSVGFAPLASAADGAVPPTYKAPPAVVAVPYSWTGVYVGTHLGVGWTRKHWGSPGPDCIGGLGSIGCLSDLGSHGASGFLGGGQTGFNWQTERLVFGIEGQFSFASLNADHVRSNAFTFANADGFVTFTGTERFSSSVKDIGTIAARIGVALGPTGGTLLYVKGGAAFGHDSFTLNFTDIVSCTRGACRTFPNSTSVGAFDGSQTRWGWMAGPGIEYALSDHWSAKVEYNYLDLGTKNITLPGSICTPTCRPASRTVAIDQTIQLIKVGINYRFWWGKAPVVAKY